MLQWSDSYSMGHERIDFEHRIFLGLLNEYQTARRDGGAKEGLLRILNEIASYARFHFLSEENLMEDIRYPQLDEHKHLHKTLIEALGNMRLGLEYDLMTAARIEQSLLDCFSQHFIVEDGKIGRYVKTEWEGRTGRRHAEKITDERKDPC
jgi:hemerythrin